MGRYYAMLLRNEVRFIGTGDQCAAWLKRQNRYLKLNVRRIAFQEA